MATILKGINLLVLTFLVMTMFSNVYPRFPKLPGDIYLDKFGFRVYLPFVSSIIISVVLALALNLLKV